VRQAQAYAAALTQAGEYNQVDIVRGGHTWAVWSGAFPTCLRFMLGAPPAAAPVPVAGPTTVAAVASRRTTPAGVTR